MDKPKGERFWWFRGASVDALRAALNDNPISVRLEMRLMGDEMTWHVVPEGVGTMEGGGGGSGNDSHICPPSCP